MDGAKIRSIGSLLVLSSLVWVTGCSIGPKQSSAGEEYRISEITFERSGSWGLRSGYKVMLRQDGFAQYAGDIQARREGKYRDRISKEQFERLGRVVVESGYFTLGDKYHAPVTDSDTITVVISYSGERKIVEDYGRGGGAGLTKVEAEIDRVAEEIAWSKDES